MQIIIGILGLSLVVVIHEAGHFFAAKMVGIEVEVFSIGWGKKFLGFTRKGTEYRISRIPFGGFVKMKGETGFQEAVEKNLDHIETTPGSFFAASPLQRIFVAFAGPAMNIVFALIVFTAINIAGYDYSSFTNRIAVIDDYPQYYSLTTEQSPAAKAGLKTGDYITAVDGVETGNFSLVQQEIQTRSLEDVEISYIRGDNSDTTTASLGLDPQSGAAILGIYPFIEPIIAAPSAELWQDRPAILEPGDKILSVGGTSVQNSLDVKAVLDSIPVEREQTTIPMTIERNGSVLEIEHPLWIAGQGENESLYLGYYYQEQHFEQHSDSLGQGILNGWNEITSTLVMTVKGIGLMFRGLNATSALSGPVKITMIVGEVTANGFRDSIATGIRAFFELLGLLSVALFFGNLLPVPILDGGQIVVAGIEFVRGKALRPQSYLKYQTVGAVIVFALLMFVMFGDMLFVFAR